MLNTYTAIMQPKDGWWIGWLEEIPGINCQERTRDELRKSLLRATREAIDLNRKASQVFTTPGCVRQEITV